MTKRIYDQAQRKLAEAAKARRAAMATYRSKGTEMPVLHPLNRAYYEAKEQLAALEK